MIAPWLAVLGLIGACLRWAGVFTELPQTWKGRLLAQLLVALALTVPVTLGLAWSESSRRTTPGKRRLGLRVEGAGAGDDLPYHRALIRSAVKVALPWKLAHAGLWQLWGRDVSVLGPVLIGLAYVVAGAQLVLLCRGGRPIHDRLPTPSCGRRDAQMEPPVFSVFLGASVGQWERAR